MISVNIIGIMNMEILINYWTKFIKNKTNLKINHKNMIDIRI